MHPMHHTPFSFYPWSPAQPNQPLGRITASLILIRWEAAPFRKRRPVLRAILGPFSPTQVSTALPLLCVSSIPICQASPSPTPSAALALAVRCRPEFSSCRIRVLVPVTVFVLVPPALVLSCPTFSQSNNRRGLVLACRRWTTDDNTTLAYECLFRDDAIVRFSVCFPLALDSFQASINPTLLFFLPRKK